MIEKQAKCGNFNKKSPTAKKTLRILNYADPKKKSAVGRMKKIASQEHNLKIHIFSDSLYWLFNFFTPEWLISTDFDTFLVSFFLIFFFFQRNISPHIFRPSINIENMNKKFTNSYLLALFS